MLGMKSRRSSMGRATERTGGLLREVLGAGARFTSKLCRNTRGVIALKFALAVPGLAVLVLGGVDLYAVQADRARLQSIADAAALAGARELGLAVDAAGPEGRALSYIEAQLSEWAHGPQSITPSVEVVTLASGERALHAVLDANRTSFFGNMLPPGGWNMHAEATATSIAVTPLCVLVHGETGSEVLRAKDSSQIRAPACLVHSNHDIRVEGVARITAAAVQAVTRAQGSISPEPATGAVAIEDPFASLDLNAELLRRTVGCTVRRIPLVVTSGRHVLSPGVHCNGISIEGTAELVLQPGEHWFLQGALVIKEAARLSGENVVLIFDQASKFEFKDRAMVNLEGREEGAYAGLVMVADRGNRQDFIISSDQVESLLGVIYVPDATLIVEGSADVARESSWTVIVSQRLELKGSPQLFINANYTASDVPVPEGVGPSSGGSRLLQ